MSLARSLSFVVSCCLAVITIGLATTASAEDFRLNFPQINIASPNGVNLQTGRFEYSRTEFSIGSLQVGASWSVSEKDDQGSNVAYANIHFPTLAGPSEAMNPYNPVNGILRSLRGSSQVINRVIYTGQTDNFVTIYLGGRKLEFSTYLLSSNGEAIGWKLQQVGNNLILRDLQGNVYNFTPTAFSSTNPSALAAPRLLSSLTKPDGEILTYSYGAHDELVSIASNRGHVIYVDYNAAAQQITVCGYNRATAALAANPGCAASPLKVTYTFTTINAYPSATVITYPTSATDVQGNVTNLTWNLYNATLSLSCISQVNSNACRLQNVYANQPGEPASQSHFDQVLRQVLANGETWTFTYINRDGGPVADDTPPLQPGQTRYTDATMFDPLGNQTHVRLANGFLDTVTTPAGTTTYARNIYLEQAGPNSWQTTDPCPSSITYPEGNSVSQVTDVACRVRTLTRNPKPGSSETATTEVVNYPPRYAYSQPVQCDAASQLLCDKPTDRTDVRGNRTDYTYDPANGMMLSETGPAVGGIRPQTRYAYVQRQAMILNASGAVVPAGPPIWVLASTSMCRTSAATGNPSAPCATAGDEVITTYDYGPTTGVNNLLVRGEVRTADGVSLRTCSAYDWRGNRISTTEPQANLTSCP